MRIARSNSAQHAVGLALLIVCLLATTGTAHAALGDDFGVASFDGSVSDEAGTPFTQAGGHPYEATTTIKFNTTTAADGTTIPDGDGKDLHVELPAGFVGNPTAAATCTEDQLAVGGLNAIILPIPCPAASQIGVVTIDLAYQFGETTLPVFNMQAPAGQPGLFAFNVLGQGVVHIVPSVRTGADYGLNVDIDDITQTDPILSTSLTLWGVPADSSHDAQRGQSCVTIGARTCFNGGTSAGTPPKPFLTNPTDCSAGPLPTDLAADSWQHPGDFLGASFISHDNASPPSPQGVTGCERLPFSPTLTARPSGAAAGAPTGYTVNLKLPQNENPLGIASAALKKALVALPRGITVSPSAANGLGACTPEQIEIETAAQPSCPSSSKIGSVTVVSPLLKDPLEGSVYLAQPTPSQLLKIYLVAEAHGVLLKLPGTIDADPVTGQLTATFDNNPQLPFTELVVSFNGGSRAPLVNPPSCGTYTTTAQLTSYASPTPVVSTSSFEINEGCSNLQGFAPAFSAGTITPGAGAFSPFTLTFGRSDADQTLSAISLRMPPGLLGVLKSVTQCAEPQASLGTCGADNLIGHTTVGAGVGSSPYYLGGNVYLTGPYKGAPFGLSVVVPAIAGPFNLGTVVVRAAIGVDRRTAQLTVTSDPLPTILQGIPLDLRTINVTIDRADFIFNPTNCSQLAVGGAIASTAGALASVASPFAAVNCATLPFKPKLSASTGAKVTKAGGASLDVKVASGDGQANIKGVKFDLPKQLPSRLTTLQKACTAVVFEDDPALCPAASNVGTASATTPILAHPLSGPAYLVSHGGEAFPDLVVVLQGEGITLELTGNTKIKSGITSSTFNAVPDAPISSFELKLPVGSHSVLAGNLPTGPNGSLCGTTLVAPTLITGQNGSQWKQSTKIGVSGCPKVKKKAKPKKNVKAKHATAKGGK
jgi:hypothetical protein